MRVPALAALLLAASSAAAQPWLIAAQQPTFPTTYPQHFQGDVLGHLATLPFDGIVVTALPTWNLMDPEWTWTAAELDDQFQNVGTRIQAAAPQLRQNLFGVVIEDPGDVFDDAAWAQAVGNWRAAAEAAQDAGFAGFYFDVEEYGDPWLDFPEDYDQPVAGLAAYRAQTRLRGRQVMEAISGEWPDAVVLFTFGPWLSEPETPAEVILFQAGDASEYELLGPLFVGFLEGAGPENLIVDGGEVYQYRTPEDFALAYRWRETGIASDSVDSAFIPEALRPEWGARVSNGFGVYNIDWQAERGFDMDPAIMETTLTNALLRTDDLVWFYTEAFDSEPGVEGVGNWYVPGSMPEPWFDAVRAAREAVAVSAAEEPNLPAIAFDLYPNPTTDLAHARFQLAEAGPVRLALFDLLGREVRVVIEETRPAKSHVVSVDMTGLPAGLYLARLETAEARWVRRFVIVR